MEGELTPISREAQHACPYRRPAYEHDFKRGADPIYEYSHRIWGWEVSKRGKQRATKYAMRARVPSGDRVPHLHAAPKAVKKRGEKTHEDPPNACSCGRKLRSPRRAGWETASGSAHQKQ